MEAKEPKIFALITWQTCLNNDLDSWDEAKHTVLYSYECNIIFTQEQKYIFNDSVTYFSGTFTAAVGAKTSSKHLIVNGMSAAVLFMWSLSVSFKSWNALHSFPLSKPHTRTKYWISSDMHNVRRYQLLTETEDDQRSIQDRADLTVDGFV